MAVDGGNTNGSADRITVAVVILCMVASTGGLIFGYDIGISGGVTTMVPFLHKFFPWILTKEAEAEAKTNMYCIYNSQVLTLFTSSLYIAGLASSLVASRLSSSLGRKNVMLLGGCTFLAGAAINCGAINIAMLILGRVLLGFGVGFTNQATPVYLSEMAPPKWRGAFNTGFEFSLVVGSLVANCINYVTSKHTRGWRISLGLATVPAFVMILAALVIPDTPSSLVERGRIAEAKRALVKVRGSDTDVELELAELVRNSEIAKAAHEEPFVTLFERRHRPQLVMAIAMPFFQSLTGISVIAFYGPVLFHSVGFGSDSALIATIILGLVNLGSVVASTLLVDRIGRRILFLEGGIQMFLCQAGVAIVLGVAAGASGTGHVARGQGILVVVLMCLFEAGFGLSWGPLGYLIPSEILPMKIRPAGQSISVAVGFLVSFIQSQAFLAMLCRFKFWTFSFYAGWLAVMTIFVQMFLPETRGIPIDQMHVVWERHWFWRRLVKDQ